MTQVTVFFQSIRLSSTNTQNSVSDRFMKIMVRDRPQGDRVKRTSKVILTALLAIFTTSTACNRLNTEKVKGTPGWSVEFDTQHGKHSEWSLVKFEEYPERPLKFCGAVLSPFDETRSKYFTFHPQSRAKVEFYKSRTPEGIDCMQVVSFEWLQ